MSNSTLYIKLNYVIEKWSDFYQTRSNKDVIFYYDHTAKDGKCANSNVSFYEEVITRLSALGWNVSPVYLGMTPSHHYRYELWGKLLQERDPRFPRFRYNKTKAAT